MEGEGSANRTTSSRRTLAFAGQSLGQARLREQCAWACACLVGTVCAVGSVVGLAVAYSSY